MDLLVLTPMRFTSSGSIGVAEETLFCVNTVFMSGSVPSSFVSFKFKVPSFELVDFL